MTTLLLLRIWLTLSKWFTSESSECSDWWTVNDTKERSSEREVFECWDDTNKYLHQLYLDQTSHVPRLLGFFVHGWKARARLDWSIRSHKIILFSPAAVRCVFLCVSERTVKRDCFHRLLRNAYEALDETCLTRVGWASNKVQAQVPKGTRAYWLSTQVPKVRVLIDFQRTQEKSNQHAR